MCENYNITPHNLKKNDGRYQSFSVRHRLSYRHGGIAITNHNEVHAELLHLICQAFYPNCVCGQPLIQQVHRISEEEVGQGRGGLERRGGDFIQGLLEIQTEAIIDVRLEDTSCDNQEKDPMKILLDQQEK